MGLYKCSTYLDLGCDAKEEERRYTQSVGTATNWKAAQSNIRKEEGRRRELEEVADASAGILQRVIGV